MKNISFIQFNKIRKDILQSTTDDCLIKTTDSNVLLSAPHGVSQVRLGKYKVAELGTIPIAYLVSKQTNSNCIIKTKNNNDDANFDSKSTYRNEILKLIKDKNIKYIFDIHGLGKKRNCDINLGINFGQNIKSNTLLLDNIVNKFEQDGFSVFIDQPFSAGPQTISGYFAKKYNVWTIQIEINCKITNEAKNIDRNNKLINCLINIINELL